jgi:multidrug resistance efflux pump
VVKAKPELKDKEPFKTALTGEREALAKHDRTNFVVLDPQIRQAESQLALAEEKLARARIVAPFDGVVLTKNANVGDTITPFSQRNARVAPLAIWP